MLIEKNIVLIGFMGSGKSLAAKELAKMYNREIISTDEVIGETEGLTIKNIFKEKGETYFRAQEEKVISKLSKETNLIIDCGGGVVLNPKNIINLKKNGVLFYLKVTPQRVWERVKNNEDRPLINVRDPLQRIKDLMKERGRLYEQADYTVDAEPKDVMVTVKEIETIFNALGK